MPGRGEKGEYGEVTSTSNWAAVAAETAKKRAVQRTRAMALPRESLGA